MRSHEERVVNEKMELDDKLNKLRIFIADNPIYTSLDGNEQYRLRNQCAVMEDYSRILGERINAFTQS